MVRVKVGGGRLCSLVARDRSRGNGSKLPQGRLRLDARKYFCPGRVLKPPNCLHRTVLESPSLGVFQQLAELVLSDMILC